MVFISSMDIAGRLRLVQGDGRLKADVRVE